MSDQINVTDWKHRCIAYFKCGHARDTDWDHMACVMLDCSEGEGLDELDDRILEMAPDQCEHGVVVGDWCEPCNRDYKQAAIDNGS